MTPSLVTRDVNLKNEDSLGISVSKLKADKSRTDGDKSKSRCKVVCPVDFPF